MRIGPLHAAVLFCSVAQSFAQPGARAEPPAAIVPQRIAAPLAASSIGPAGHWVRIPRDSLQPPQITGHDGIVDPVHRRFLMFCGTSSSIPDDVWQMPLDGPLSWHPLTVSGVHPPSRVDAGVAYDPVRSRMIVYGGAGGSGDFGDVWALDLSTDPPAWSEILPAGTAPPSRAYHTMTYDPVRDRMLIFGGIHVGGARLQDVWALKLAAGPEWQALAPGGTPPAARYGHAATYDPVRDRLLVHGGASGFDPFSDLFALSLSGTPTWSEVEQVDRPQGRRYHALFYDPVHDGLVLFGGDPNSGYALADTWTMSFASGTWSLFEAPGPGAYTRFAAAYDAQSERLLIEGAAAPVAATWAYSLEPPGWSRLLPPDDLQSPGGRIRHAAARDPLRDRMLVHGGYDGGGPAAGDVWALDLDATPVWSRVDASGTPPVSAGHALVFDPPRDRLLVFAGFLSMDSIPALTFGAAPEWTMLHPQGPAPSNREAPGVVYDPVRDRVLLFGGFRPNAIEGGFGFNDLWQLSLGPSPAWTPLETQGPTPPGRGYSGFLYDAAGDRLVVIGGRGTNISGCCPPTLRDVWQLSLAGTPTWQELTPQPPRYVQAGAVVLDAFRHRALVYSSRYPADSVFALSLDAPESWQYLAPADGPPAPRLYTAATFDPDDDRMLLFSGETGYPIEPETWELRFESPVIHVPPTELRGPRLTGAIPNPSSGAMRVGFTLAGRAPATLELFDTAGRRIARHEVGALGPGSHTWQIPEAATLPAGLYLLRLRCLGTSRVVRAVHIR